jgi:hypothetical protein
MPEVLNIRQLPIIPASIPTGTNTFVQAETAGQIDSGAYTNISGTDVLVTVDAPGGLYGTYPLPSGTSDITIWVRNQFGFVRVLSASNAQLSEIDNGGPFAWKRHGRFSRATLGAAIKLQKNGSGVLTARGVDQLCFAEDDSFNPETGLSGGGPRRLSLELYSQVLTGTLNTAGFGANAWPLVRAGRASDYTQKILDANPEWIRIHDADIQAPGQIGTGSNPDVRTGIDAAKVAALYSELPSYPGLKIIQTIPFYEYGFPVIDRTENNPVSASIHPQLNMVTGLPLFVAYCVEFATKVNTYLASIGKNKIQYWEPMNERDDQYRFYTNRSDLYEIWLRCAIGLKNYDPTLKMVGLAFTYHRDYYRDEFINYVSPNGGQRVRDFLDVYSWHEYMGLSTQGISVDQAFSRVDGWLSISLGIKNALLPNTNIEVHMNEANFSYEANPGNENRHLNGLGASVLSYAMLTHAVNNLGLFTWNHFNDGYNGALDNDATVERPVYAAWDFLCKYKSASFVPIRTNSSDIYAVSATGTPQGRGTFIINKSLFPHTVKVPDEIPRNARILQIYLTGSDQSNNPADTQVIRTTLASILDVNGEIPLRRYGLVFIAWEPPALPAPIFSSISSPRLWPGFSHTVLGANFPRDTQVKIDNVPVPTYWRSSTALSFTGPGAIGTYTIGLTNSAATRSLTLVPVIPSAVTDIQPRTASVNTLVTITGVSLNGLSFPKSGGNDIGYGDGDQRPYGNIVSVTDTQAVIRVGTVIDTRSYRFLTNQSPGTFINAPVITVVP